MLQRNKNEQITFKSNNLDKSHKYKIEQKKQDTKTCSIWFHLNKGQRQKSNYL